MRSCHSPPETRCLPPLNQHWVQRPVCTCPETLPLFLTRTVDFYFVGLAVFTSLSWHVPATLKHFFTSMQRRKAHLCDAFTACHLFLKHRITFKKCILFRPFGVFYSSAKGPHTRHQKLPQAWILCILRPCTGLRMAGESPCRWCRFWVLASIA